jgi:hypothetical protein
MISDFIVMVLVSDPLIRKIYQPVNVRMSLVQENKQCAEKDFTR